MIHTLVNIWTTTENKNGYILLRELPRHVIGQDNDRMAARASFAY